MTEPKRTMEEAEARAYTSTVEKWWNDHPFTLGLAEQSGESYDLTGRVETLNPKFFDEVDRKMRKFYGTSGQAEGQPLLSALVPYNELNGKRVLDIAIGSGWTTAELAKAGATVTGIDLTDQAIRMTGEHLALKGLKADLQKTDAQAMPFEAGSFDYVLAWGCLMHMPNTPQAIAEISRVLTPGGKMLAYMYNKRSWTYWFNFIFLRGILKGDLLKYKGNTTAIVSRYTDGAPTGGNSLTKVYSPSEAEALFEDAGFHSVNAWPFYIPHEVDGWPMGKFPFFKHLPASIKTWLGKKLAWGLIVEAQKV